MAVTMTMTTDFVMQESTTSSLPTTTQTLSSAQAENAQYFIQISPGNLPFWICIGILIVLCCLFGCIWGFVCLRCKLHRLTSNLEAKQRELEELTMQHYLEKTKSMSDSVPCSQTHTTSRPSPSQFGVVTPLISHMTVPSLPPPCRSTKPRRKPQTPGPNSNSKKTFNAQYITISTVDGNGDADADADDEHNHDIDVNTSSPTEPHQSSLQVCGDVSLTLDHDVSINTRAATAGATEHDHDHDDHHSETDTDTHTQSQSLQNQHHHGQLQHLSWLQVESTPYNHGHATTGQRHGHGHSQQHRRSRTVSCSAPAHNGLLSYAMLLHEHDEITPDLPVDADDDDDEGRRHHDRYMRQTNQTTSTAQDDSRLNLHYRYRSREAKHKYKTTSVILPFNKHAQSRRARGSQSSEVRDGDRSTHWFSDCESDAVYLVDEMEKLRASEAKNLNTTTQQRDEYNQTQHAKFSLNLAHNIQTVKLIEDDIIDAMHKERHCSMTMSRSECGDHDEDDETMYSVD